MHDMQAAAAVRHVLHWAHNFATILIFAVPARSAWSDPQTTNCLGMHRDANTIARSACCKLQDDHGNVLRNGNMERAVKVLERMENQNTYKELAMDFKVSCHQADLQKTKIKGSPSSGITVRLHEHSVPA